MKVVLVYMSHNMPFSWIGWTQNCPAPESGLDSLEVSISYRSFQWVLPYASEQALRFAVSSYILSRRGYIFHCTNPRRNLASWVDEAAYILVLPLRLRTLLPTFHLPNDRSKDKPIPMAIIHPESALFAMHAICEAILANNADSGCMIADNESSFHIGSTSVI